MNEMNLPEKLKQDLDAYVAQIKKNLNEKDIATNAQLAVAHAEEAQKQANVLLAYVKQIQEAAQAKHDMVAKHATALLAQVQALMSASNPGMKIVIQEAPVNNDTEKKEQKGYAAKDEPKKELNKEPKKELKKEPKKEEKETPSSSDEDTPTNSGWSVVSSAVRRPPKGGIVKAITSRPQLVGSMVHQWQMKDLVPTTKYPLALNFNVPAVAINDLYDCHKNLGKLCWYDARKIFVYSLNGFIFPVYMGRVFEQGKDHPYKVAEFRSDKACAAPDDFYHPPEYDTSSTDLRNFKSPINYVYGEKKVVNRPALRLGDSELFAGDVSVIEGEDERYQSDFCAHTDAHRIGMYEFKKLN